RVWRKTYPKSGLGTQAIWLAGRWSADTIAESRESGSVSVYRWVVALALVALVAVPVQASVGDDDLGPITEDAFVQDLRDAGYRNGDMPSFRMMEVEGCVLERDAAYTLSLMLEEARADG